MNRMTKTLRNEYHKLTPFEREALLVREAVGKKRAVEVDALASQTPREAYWMTVWGGNFFRVSAFAMFRALWAERAAWILFTREVDAEGEEERQAAAEKAEECFRAASGWMRALLRLEEETGAPLMDTGKMLDPDYAGFLLARNEGEDIDASAQYAALREIWDAACYNINKEDRGRALPPCQKGEPL